MLLRFKAIAEKDEHIFATILFRGQDILEGAFNKYGLRAETTNHSEFIR